MDLKVEGPWDTEKIFLNSKHSRMAKTVTF